MGINIRKNFNAPQINLGLSQAKSAAKEIAKKIFLMVITKLLQI